MRTSTLYVKRLLRDAKKRCPNCGEIKEIGSFYSGSTRCKACFSKLAKENRKLIKESRPDPVRDLFNSGKKICPRCGEIKELADFYPSKSRKPGVYSDCRDCNCEYNRGGARD